MLIKVIDISFIWNKDIQMVQSVIFTSESFCLNYRYLSEHCAADALFYLNIVG